MQKVNGNRNSTKVWLNKSNPWATNAQFTIWYMYLGAWATTCSGERVMLKTYALLENQLEVTPPSRCCGRRWK